MLSQAPQELYGAVRASALVSEALSQQGKSKSEEQFASSPDLRSIVTDAVIYAHGALAEISWQYLNGPKVQDGTIAALLKAGGIWTKLRA